MQTADARGREIPARADVPMQYSREELKEKLQKYYDRNGTEPGAATEGQQSCREGRPAHDAEVCNERNEMDDGPLWAGDTETTGRDVEMATILLDALSYLPRETVDKVLDEVDFGFCYDYSHYRWFYDKPQIRFDLGVLSQPVNAIIVVLHEIAHHICGHQYPADTWEMERRMEDEARKQVHDWLPAVVRKHIEANGEYWIDPTDRFISEEGPDPDPPVPDQDVRVTDAIYSYVNRIAELIEEFHKLRSDSEAPLRVLPLLEFTGKANQELWEKVSAILSTSELEEALAKIKEE